MKISDSLRARLGNLAPDKGRLGIGRGPPSEVEALWISVPGRVPAPARKGREEETQAAGGPGPPHPLQGGARQHSQKLPSGALWFSLCAALKRARREKWSNRPK